MLKESRALVEDFNRRGVLRGALTLGALTLLTGCDVSENESVQNGLRAVSSWNDACAGGDLPAQSPRADIQSVAGGQAAAI